MNGISSFSAINSHTDFVLSLDIGSRRQVNLRNEGQNIHIFSNISIELSKFPKHLFRFNISSPLHLSSHGCLSMCMHICKCAFVHMYIHLYKHLLPALSPTHQAHCSNTINKARLTAGSFIEALYTPVNLKYTPISLIYSNFHTHPY